VGVGGPGNGSGAGDDGMEGQFGEISRLMYRIAGVNLHDGKKQLVRGRIGRRLRDAGFGGFRDYVAHVKSDAGRAELRTMVDILTTNKTSFFREASHFDFLAEHVAESALPREGLRLWSAGCSSGEEPYTLAMVLREALPRSDFGRVRILATDLDRRMVEATRAAVYAESRLAGVSPELRRRHFDPAPGREADGLRVKPELRSTVRVACLNLMGRWPMDGPFDAIFCRNVMIYFDAETRQRLVRRFSDLLREGGHLFVGHSESLNGLSHGLTYVQPAVYRR
jgi:chemotaxis protein methyltransferase CheR